MIDKFIENLEDLKKAIENEDGQKLEEIFTKTKKIRKDIVEAGQDVKKPDFGKKIITKKYFLFLINFIFQIFG